MLHIDVDVFEVVFQVEGRLQAHIGWNFRRDVELEVTVEKAE
jgi:hypothetical protein